MTRCAVFHADGGGGGGKYEISPSLENYVWRLSTEWIEEIN